MAFSGCSKLETINIPSAVISIQACAFSDCHSLSNVTSYATIPPALGWGVFSFTGEFGDKKHNNLSVLQSSIKQYRESDWNQYFNNITVETNVE